MIAEDVIADVDAQTADILQALRRALEPSRLDDHFPIPWDHHQVSLYRHKNHKAEELRAKSCID
jgi:hypothetical protein